MLIVYRQDSKCNDLQYQYLWGPGVMVSPVTGENTTTGRTYLPDDIFYDFYTHETVRGNGSMIEQEVPYTTIPLYYKGGNIIAQRVESANTTTELRKKNFEIIIAPGLDGTASGSLYFDDGVSLEQPATTYINFKYTSKNVFSFTGSFGYDPGVNIQSVVVLGSNSDGSSTGAAADAISKVHAQDIPLTEEFTLQM